MALREFSGAAPRTTLTGALSGAATSFDVASGTGYPTGTNPFVVVVDRGLSTEEKILCSARSSASFTVATSGRGYDGTTAQAHAGGAYVEHCIDSVTITEANLHANDADADNVAHAATKISYAGGTGMSATTVEAAIDELATEKADWAGGTFSGDVSVPDEAYHATNWNGSVEVPTKNAVRDKFESLSTGGLLAYKTSSAGWFTGSTTSADVDATNLAVAFTVPSSGNVLVRLTAYCYVSAGSVTSGFWGLREASSDVVAPLEVLNGASTDKPTQVMSVAFVVTGLVAAAAKTYKWAWKVSGASAQITIGTSVAPAVMEVHALP